MRGFAMNLVATLALLVAFGCAGKSVQSSSNGTGSAGAPIQSAGSGGVSSLGTTGSSGASASTGTSGSTGTTISFGGAIDAGEPARLPRQRCVGPCTQEGPRPVPTARPACPQSEPPDGSACVVGGLDCTYGADPSAACRQHYTCQYGENGAVSSWHHSAADPSHPCTALPLGYCPPQAPAQASSCFVGSYDTPCVYGTLLCFCSNNLAALGSTGAWACWGPPADLRCPAWLPNIGEGCAPESTECDYDESCFDADLICKDAVWQYGSPSCLD
jgi:hypothetical protein